MLGTVKDVLFSGSLEDGREDNRQGILLYRTYVDHMEGKEY